MTANIRSKFVIPVLNKVFNNILSGRIQIPAYGTGIAGGPDRQSAEESAELLDSITRGMPVGNLVIAELNSDLRFDERPKIEPLTVPNRPDEIKSLLVVDGCRRLTNLVHTLAPGRLPAPKPFPTPPDKLRDLATLQNQDSAGKPKGNSYLEWRVFLYLKNQTWHAGPDVKTGTTTPGGSYESRGQDPRYFPASNLLFSEDFNAATANIKSANSPETCEAWIETAVETASRICNYQIPVITVEISEYDTIHILRKRLNPHRSDA